MDVLHKLSVEQIRQRFDGEVERFSNLETGQSAVMDAPLMLELVAQAVSVLQPEAQALLDIGCGAGNYALKLLERVALREIMLVDLSENMLARARERLGISFGGTLQTQAGDMRAVELGTARFDVITAGATLHHLRTDAEWRAMFLKIYQALKPGGTFWIIDLVRASTSPLEQLMTARWGEYLTNFRDTNYRDQVFAYVEAEDTPQTLQFQLELLREVGFTHTEVLHKVACFAAFGGVKEM